MCLVSVSRLHFLSLFLKGTTTIYSFNDLEKPGCFFISTTKLTVTKISFLSVFAYVFVSIYIYMSNLFCPFSYYLSLKMILFCAGSHNYLNNILNCPQALVHVSSIRFSHFLEVPLLFSITGFLP